MANYFNLFSNNTLKNNIEKITLNLNWQNANNNSLRGLFTWSWHNLARVNIVNPDQLKYITDMSTMFREGDIYKLNLENWDVSNVQDFGWFFMGQRYLREVDFSSWDTSNAKRMDGFFDSCYNLKKADVSNWNVHQVWNFATMFEGAHFTVDLSKWNFINAKNFYSMLSSGGERDIKINGNWAFPKLENSGYIFSDGWNGNIEFSCPLTAPNLTNAAGMFGGWENLGAIINFRWCPSITNAAYMFDHMNNCNVAFLNDMENWDVSNLECAYQMFLGQALFYHPDLDLSKWNVSKLRNACAFLSTGMSGVYTVTNRLTNINVSNWNLSEYNRGYLFNGLWETHKINTTNWILNNTNMNAMFDNCTNLTELTGYENWNIDNLYDISFIFFNCRNLNINVNHWKVNAGNIQGVFYGMENLDVDVSNWNTSRVNNIHYIFRGINSVAGLSNWDVSNLVNIQGAFEAYKGSNLNDVFNWNLTGITDMRNTFAWLNNIAIIDLSKWNFSQPINNLEACFYSSRGLTEIRGLENINTSQVNTLRNTFLETINLKVVDIKDWNVSNVNNLYQCFESTGLETINLKNWIPLNCTNFVYMFFNASKATAIDLSSAYTQYSNANLSQMFSLASSVRDIYLNSFRFNNSMNTFRMFSSTPTDCNIWVRDAFAKNFLTQAFPEWTNIYIATALSVDIFKDNYSIMNTATLTVSFDIYGGSNGFVNQDLIINTSSSTQKTNTTGSIDYTNGKLQLDIQALQEGADQITVTVSDTEGQSTQVILNITITPYIPTFYEVSPVDGSTYTFELNADGYYESNNKGQHNSYAMCKVTFKTSTGKLILDCINYAENNYDFGILSNLDIDPSLSLSSSADTSNVYYSFKGKSQSTVQTVSYTGIDGEEHFIYIKYRKDGSASNNNDSLQFKVRFE